MRRLLVFKNVSLDGYIADSDFARCEDEEWKEFVTGTGAGTILLGRATYDLFGSFWPTPQAAAGFPAAAVGMNQRPKVVFSRTLDHADWNNTTVIRSDIVAAVRAMKQEPGDDLVIFGSGRTAAQLAREHLIDEFQIMMIPAILGSEKSIFSGVEEKLKLTKSRVFANGNVPLYYEPLTR